MFTLGPIGFAAPWLLTALIALPALWWLLRAVPPAPIRRAFPGVILLLGLEDRDSEARRTPLWLMLLRMAALAAMIIGFAGPVLNPPEGVAGRGSLLILVDDSWAAAPDWQARMSAINTRLANAKTAGRPVALVAASSPPTPGTFPRKSAGDIAQNLPGLAPQAYAPDHATALDWAQGLDMGFETLWLSDGLDSPNRADLARALATHGALTVLEPPAPRLGLLPARIEDGLIQLTALRSRAGTEQDITITALGPDPSGVGRALARTTLSFATEATRAETQLSLPPELRNRISRFRIEASRSAGALTLTDDSLKRRKVGLVTATAGRETLELLSPGHYLRQALQPSAEVIEGPPADLIAAGPDTIILPDSASLAAPEAEALERWVTEGGQLLRFAGPRLAATGTGPGGQPGDDPLLPVRLRAGGRSVGGAMSWGTPQHLAPFPESSPFYGLAIPDDVSVSAQVLAEPGPELASRTIAALSDGTPLVTRKSLGNGTLVLFHSSANAEWSSLALSGLFVQMLDRLAVASRSGPPDRSALAGTIWTPDRLLDGFGSLQDAGARAGIAGDALLGQPGPGLPPGLYRSDARLIAVNTLAPDASLAPARWPAGIVPSWQGESREHDLTGPLLLAALLLLAADMIASLALSGRLSRNAVKNSALMLTALILPLGLPDVSEAAAPLARRQRQPWARYLPCSLLRSDIPGTTPNPGHS
ncbi:MAG: BatA domain-containing protein [Maritimibacter sp.]